MYPVLFVLFTLLYSTQAIYDASKSMVTVSPYQAAILKLKGNTGEFEYFCSGVIVSTRTVLTTAYCVGQTRYQDLRVRVGATHHNTGGLVVNVDILYKHHNYNSYFDNDIGVLRLSITLVPGINIGIVNLPAQNETMPSNQGSFTAWGYSGYYKSITHLQKKRLDLIPYEACNWEYNLINSIKDVITSRMLCFSRGPCEEDFGGPLVYNGTLYGIFSWGLDCTDPKPSVFTNIAFFRTWIDFYL